MKATLALVSLLLITTTFGKLLDGKSEQRGYSESITRILDYLYPKDDGDSKIMKEIFSLLADDGPPSLEGGLDALDYLLRR
ncbi:unnamed protein product [Pieris macdunnoughi]|uniref:Uncharacterized protein n=1 Tax=Pieris macdunnoughi TaxID=345717 RepID=A0A821PP34_9NEOP|nr:unnamed protein product [Pieris macdunnoughi]